eukprot:TRINITY_DN33394_c0_g1_i1.p1 TRINITY_DN33394_c0_g1~~TRINITY_DN33394_c0_g1_i1.p1  ORF type:complete len:205 (-),score=37.74 TRINITY_DN33394_c0_g1_i1:106-720(-)
MLCFIVFFFLMIRRPPRSTLSSSSAASDVYKRQVCRDRGVHQQGCYTSHQQGCYTTTTSSSRAAVAYNKPLPPDAFTSSPLEPLRPPRPSTTTLLSFDDEDNSSSKIAALPPWRKGTVAGVWMDIVWVLDDNSMMLEPLYGPFETFRTRYEIVITGLLDTVPAFRDPLLNVESVAVSYTHLRAHETPEHLVCRLLLEKKKKNIK